VSKPVSTRSASCGVFLPLFAPRPAAVNSSVYLDPSCWTLFRNPAYVYSERASIGSLDPTRQRDDREADTAVGANPQRLKICNQSPRSWLPPTCATGGIFNSNEDADSGPFQQGVPFGRRLRRQLLLHLSERHPGQLLHRDKRPRRLEGRQLRAAGGLERCRSACRPCRHAGPMFKRPVLACEALGAPPFFIDTTSEREL